MMIFLPKRWINTPEGLWLPIEVNGMRVLNPFAAPDERRTMRDQNVFQNVWGSFVDNMKAIDPFPLPKDNPNYFGTADGEAAPEEGGGPDAESEGLADPGGTTNDGGEVHNQGSPAAQESKTDPTSAHISPGQIIHNSYGAIMFRSGLV